VTLLRAVRSLIELVAALALSRSLPGALRRSASQLTAL
jgi:hypothetical protein